MIAAARKRHRATIMLFAVVVSTIFVWGMMARRQMPILASQPQAAGSASKVGEVTFALEEHLLAADVLRNDSQLLLEWTTTPVLPYPDILVYWQHGDAFNEAILLGNYASQKVGYRSHLPAEANLSGAALVLYSLAHQQEVGRAAIVPVKGGQP